MAKLIWIIDEEWNDYDIEEKIIKNGLPGYDIRYSKSDIYNDLESFGKYADGIITETYIDINANVINKLESCKIISVYGIGYDRIDVEAAKQKGILVANVPSYCVEEVSDHVIAFIYEFSKKVNTYKDKILKGLWGINSVVEMPQRIKGSILFLVGFGKIARAEALKAKCLGMEVLAYDPYVNEHEMSEHGVKKVDWDEGFQLADYVSVVTRLTKETRGMIGMREFKLMKKSAVLINASRGEIVIQDELLDAIKKGVIRGAGLDVLDNEPPDLDNEILKCDNIIITPHVSYLSSESLIELRETVTLNVVKTLRGQKIDNII